MPTEPLILHAVIVPLDKLIAAGISALCIAAVSWFYRASRTGLALRAIADSQSLAGAMGINVQRHFTLTWAIAGVLLTHNLLLREHGRFASHLPRASARSRSAGLVAIRCGVSWRPSLQAAGDQWEFGSHRWLVSGAASAGDLAGAIARARGRQKVDVAIVSII